MTTPTRPKRHHPGRWGRNPAPSGHAGDQQAIAADLRQADDLLPAVHADPGRHPRHPADLDPGGHRRLPAPAGRRQPGRHFDYLCRAAAAGRTGPGVHHRPRFRRPGQRHADPRRQHLLRPVVPQDAGKDLLPNLRGHGVRLRGQRPRALRRGGDRRPGQGALDRGEAPAAEIVTTP